MNRSSRLSGRAAAAYVGVGALFVAAYYLVPGPAGVGSLPKVCIYAAVSLSAAVAILVGVRRNRPSYAAPWLLFAASQAVYFSADAIFYVYHDVLSDLTYPAPADALYLAHYPFVIAGLMLLIRRRSSGDRGTLIDALILGAAGALLSWTFLIEPFLTGSGSPFVRATSAVFPVMDLIVLTLTARLAVGAGARTASFWLLIGGLSILLVTDAIYGGMQIAGTYSGPGNFLDAAWLGFDLLFGAAALHPSMAALTDPAPGPETRPTLSRWRIAILTFASLIAPATLLVEYRIRGSSELTEDLITAAVFSAILVLLVIARLADAVRAQRRVTAEREQAMESFRRTAKQQAAVAQLGLQAAEGVELDALMRRAVQAVATCVDAEFTRIFEGEPDGQRLTLTASVGQEHLVGKARVDGGADTQAGYTLRVGRPVVAGDMRTETRFEGVFLLEGRGVRSGVTAPINGADRPYGVISAHSTQPGAFDDQDATFLQAVANVLTVAISRVQAEQLHAELERRRRLESTSQLAGGIAHDFNNLLGVILNYAAFAEDDLDRDPGAARADLAEVRKAAGQAADLTRQMLIFGRGTGRRLHALEINAIVRDAEGLLRSTVGERIVLRLELEPDLWRTKGDPGHIQQILVNLVLNARDAMPRGGTLVIETRNVEVSPAGQMDYPVPPGKYIRLAVSDTGIGMSEEVMDRAFDPFFTTKAAGKGTGLGLASVYRLARDSGGEIRLDSKPERGTTVGIYLPASAEGTPVSATDPRASGNGRETSGGNGTILVAEDDAAVRGLTARILSGHGYRVLEAEDAAQAERACEQRNGEIDLLLTDVVMPDMSGNELGELILERHPEIKVLYMSGYADDVMSGAGVVLQKPFAPETLLTEVREMLAH